MNFFSSTNEPILIAGPCSAETEVQIFETAKALKNSSIQLFRAGVWKPRTKPGSFEGNGELALTWLAAMKQELQLPFAVEVAEPKHVELALKYNADAVWIGARTTVNPFQVQQIADSLKNIAISVLVKNPVNPDVDLWEGAIERLQQANVNEVAAVHRGFSSYHTNSLYRNQPNWTIPIELKRRKPSLSIICDPSHIAGKRSLVPEIAQRALDLCFNGLMIETHCHPDQAWTDAKQQLTPEELLQLICNLIVRKQHITGKNDDLTLETLRQQMDSIDAEIIDLLARRMDLSGHMGKHKNEKNLTVYTPERWREIVESRSEQALKRNLSAEFIVSLYEKIHHESIQKQLSVWESLDKATKE